MTESTEKLVLPHKMNSFLKTGPRFGPNAHSGPIREIKGPQRDERPHVTLPYVPAPNTEPFKLPRATGGRKHAAK